MKKIVIILLCLLPLQVRADAQSALAAVQSIRGVLKASEDNAGNLYVFAQRDPKTIFNNVAVNLCRVVRSHHARIFLVKIVDAATVIPKSKPKDWALLGAANCGMVP